MASSRARVSCNSRDMCLRACGREEQDHDLVTWWNSGALEASSLAISVPRGETAVLQHFQAQMSYGLFVPDAQGIDRIDSGRLQPRQFRLEFEPQLGPLFLR
jgi:hypothetical protein